MEKLATTIREEIKGNATTPESLDEAAKEWAAFALSTYTGKLLNRALAISTAITNFTAALIPRN